MGNEYQRDMVLEDSQVEVGPWVSTEEAFPHTNANHPHLHSEYNDVGENDADDACTLTYEPNATH